MPHPGAPTPRHVGRVWRRLRTQVLTEEDTCGLCHRPVDRALPWPHPASPSVDLIVPRSQGGSWRTRSNLQLTHLRCNVAAGDKKRTRKPRRVTFATSRRW